MTATSEVIRKYILDNVKGHPRDIARLTRQKFGITRQAINRHVQCLIENESIEASGTTKDRSYALKTELIGGSYHIAAQPAEHIVWDELILPRMRRYHDNVRRVCDYGFSEMFNNAVEHSEGTEIIVILEFTVKTIRIIIEDNGIGIFEKIKSRFNLLDHRQAILELSKGKLTTDPDRHSGQGIFFTSRMFDYFAIASGHLYFSHDRDRSGDWLTEMKNDKKNGTGIDMIISTETKTTPKEVFDRFTDLASDDYAFSKTHVPLSLAKYGGEQLVSRSQARQVLARFDRFAEVLLDFTGVDSIGQAFADEIFRVFAKKHRDIKILTICTNEQIKKMIARVKSDMSTPSSPDNTTFTVE